MSARHLTLAVAAALTGTGAMAQGLCIGFGPQTPRDITMREGANVTTTTIAPSPAEMNLCNLHTHTHAEHKGPGFSIWAGAGDHGGWRCNGTDALSESERTAYEGEVHYEGVEPGDTIEVHWVYTSCDTGPGAGLGSCFTDSCTNPQLRVEAQVFLVVNDGEAADFMDYVYAGAPAEGRHQPRALPEGAGAPVVFAGSTTGPSFTQSTCSPFQVTWSVRPECIKLDIASLHAWGASGSVMEEEDSHGVRQLVTAPELLSPIN